jgi:hypothetical protein
MPAATPCSRRGSLRITGATFVVVAAINLLFGPLIITITDLCPCRSIIEDDYLAVTRRPEDVTVEIIKKLSDEFLIAKSINNERGRVDHWGLLGGVALLKHR